jgi:hypothetical protein
VRIEIVPPESLAGHGLRLRLRLPRGLSVRAVNADGARVSFDRASGTIDLTRVAAHLAAGEPIDADARLGAR